jgi:hypothetical protein
MSNFKTADGRVLPYQNKHHNLLHSGIVAVTGALTVDLGIDHANFDVVVSFAEEPGNADDVARVACVKGADPGTFTISVKDLVLDASATPLITWLDAAVPYNISFFAIASDSAS